MRSFFATTPSTFCALWGLTYTTAATTVLGLIPPLQTATLHLQSRTGCITLRGSGSHGCGARRGCWLPISAAAAELLSAGSWARSGQIDRHCIRGSDETDTADGEGPRERHLSAPFLQYYDTLIAGQHGWVRGVSPIRPPGAPQPPPARVRRDLSGCFSCSLYLGTHTKKSPLRAPCLYVCAWCLYANWHGTNEPCMLITLINAGQLANIAGPDAPHWQLLLVWVWFARLDQGVRWHISLLTECIFNLSWWAAELFNNTRTPCVHQLGEIGASCGPL